MKIMVTTSGTVSVACGLAKGIIEDTCLVLIVFFIEIVFLVFDMKYYTSDLQLAIN